MGITISKSKMTYQLRSFDNKLFKVSPKILRLSSVLSNFLESIDNNKNPTIFPIQNVHSEILAKLLEFCQLQLDLENESVSHEGSEGDDNEENERKSICFQKIIHFIQENKNIIGELIKAADYLQISSFLQYFLTDQIFLKSSDDVYFQVTPEICKFSKILSTRLEDEEDATLIEHVDDLKQKLQIIPILNVSGNILKKIIEYCEFHSKIETENISDDEVQKFDTEFVLVSQSDLFETILAANYLDISNLLDLTCETVANMIKGKTPEEIRETFGIKNDFTPEEEEDVRKKQQWAFD